MGDLRIELQAPVHTQKSKEKVSMIRIYHNHTLHGNPRHREEEPQNN